MVKVGKTEEELDIAMAFKLWPLHDRSYALQLHLNPFQSDDEVDPANSLHMELVF